LRTETITLGEKEYILREMPVRPARQFREALKAEFGSFIALVEGSPNVELTDMGAVSGLLRTLSATLLDSVDKALDLLLQYSPELAKDREYIEDNAVGSQVVDGFLAAVGLSFPFFGSERIGRLTSTIRQIGSSSKPT
jgi:hypothetical protein